MLKITFEVGTDSMELEATKLVGAHIHHVGIATHV